MELMLGADPGFGGKIPEDNSKYWNLSGTILMV